jgi:hypothetical protein
MDTTEYHLQHITQTLRALEAKRGDVPDLMYMSIVNSVLTPYNVSVTDVPALEGFVGRLRHRRDCQRLGLRPHALDRSGHRPVGGFDHSSQSNPIRYVAKIHSPVT